MKAHVIEDTQGRREAIEPCTAPCAIEQGMRIIGGKWTGSILYHLRDGPVRFNDLARMVSGASKKMVTERLRHLEAHGLVSRTVLTTSPVSVEYAATDEGRTAIALLDQMRSWSENLPRSEE